MFRWEIKFREYNRYEGKYLTFHAIIFAEKYENAVEKIKTITGKNSIEICECNFVELNGGNDAEGEN